MFKHQMKPLSPKGATKLHKGKGSEMTGMPSRSQMTSLANSPGATMNDYAKATPMAQPAPSMPGDMFPGVM